MWEAARSQEMARTVPLLPPKEGRGRIIHSFVPTLSKKEQFPFPLSSQARGPKVCDALPPHSCPQSILPAANRVRLGDAGPPHAPLASPYGDSGSSARMSQNAGPSVPSSSTPLRCTTTGTPIVSSIITQARAPSTRQAYALKWSLFANWCSSRREDPRRCTIGVVLSFLQERL